MAPAPESHIPRAIILWAIIIKPTRIQRQIEELKLSGGRTQEEAEKRSADYESHPTNVA